MAAKIILARVPFSYSLWRRLGVFRHGSVPLQLASAHVRLTAALETHARFGRGPIGKLLELGPGDSLSLAIAARSQNIGTAFVDVGDFAAYDAEAYALVARDCGGEVFARGIDFSTRASMLRSCSAEYLTKGLRSLKNLTAASIDISTSVAVLEHVRVHEFDETMQELFRVTRSGGTGRHIIDVMDHLGGGLNNLRFSSKHWESDFFAQSGFYTNRLRPTDIIRRARGAGFEADLVSAKIFQNQTLKRAAMAPEFRNLPDSDYEIAVFEMALRKP